MYYVVRFYFKQRALTAKVCHQMAEHAVLRQRNYDAAIEHYKEALNFDPDDEVSISNIDYKQNFTLYCALCNR